MMTAQRLPIPGSDDGQWGNILNDFLSQAHNADGSLSSSAVTAAGAYTKPGGGVPTGDIADGAVTQAKLASSVQATLASVAPTPSDGGTWSASRSYAAGSIVSYGGARYIAPAAVSTNAFFDNSKWILLGSVPDTF
ncbi:MAG: hypothetical protein JWN38_1021 [Candidatus Saccharibacteria bacterium]|nr:hypothetical protein [Candidatus Saccharibacteria bacterium]